MTDDVAFVESQIKRRLPDVSVFQNSTDDAEAEIDIQNVPGRPLSFIRLLLSHKTAQAIRGDPDLAERVILTLDRALRGPSDEPEALLDLREQL